MRLPRFLSSPSEPQSTHPAMTYRPPLYLSVIHYSLVGSLFFAAFAVIYVVFWFLLATGLRDSTIDWFAEQRQKGYVADHQGIELTGFPFRISVALTEPAFASATTAKAPWSWRGARLVAWVRPWSPSRITVDAAGEHAGSFFQDRQLRHFSGTVGVFDLTVKLDGNDVPEQAEVKVERLDLKEDIGPWTIAARNLHIQAQKNRPGDKKDDKDFASFDMRIFGQDLALPRILSLPLGNLAKQVELEGSVMGTLPIAPLPETLPVWRDAGGRVEITRAHIEYGPVEVRGSGTLALDGDLQPVGAFSASVAGFAQVLDAFKHKGMIGSSEAAMAKIVLSALAKPPAGGGRPKLALPITIQNRSVFAGPVKLVTFDPIDWSAIK